MRLTCPNCGARYEVDDGLIPPDGRDVQCSNCGSTWFQPGRRPEPEAPAAPEAEAGPSADPTRGPDPAEADAATQAQDPGATDPQGSDRTAAAGPRPRRPIDPEVRDILRQEAEREARLRRGQPDPVETQAEMPLDQPAGRGRAKPTPDADDLHEARDAFDVHQGSTRHAEGTRRDLLPDIEEINSTLRATGDRAASEADASDVDTVDTALRRRRGTRLGFALSLMVAAALTWAYVNAGLLTDWLPQAEPVIARFVGLVDAARIWLDGVVQGLLGDDRQL